MTDLAAPRRTVAQLSLEGEVDMLTAGVIPDAAATALAEGAGELRVDCSAVTFMDSQGLTALVQAHRDLAEADVALTLVGVPDRVQRVLATTGLDRVLRCPPLAAG